MENAMDLKISLEAKYQVLRELMEHIEQTPQKVFEAALTLTAIRNEFSNNIAFRDELDEQGIAINKDDRAAMIRFGQASQQVQDTIKHFMRKEGRISFRKLPTELWEESSHQCEDSPSAKTEIENVEIMPEVPAFLEKPTIEMVEKDTKTLNPKKDCEIQPKIQGPLTTALKKVHKNFTHLVQESIMLGLLTADGVAISNTSGRLLFNLNFLSAKDKCNKVLSEFDLLKPSGCKNAEEQLMPFLRKHAEALKANPDQLAQLWSDDLKSKRDEVIKADQEDKYAKTMAEIASRGEKEVIVCGIQIWPSKHTNFTSFSYEQLRLAWFMFLDAEKIAEANLWSKKGRKDRAIAHRWLIKNYRRSFAVFKDRPGFEEAVQHADYVGLAWYELSMALQNGPDEKLQTSIPWTDITAI